MAGKPCTTENMCIGSDLLCSTELLCECEFMYANKTGQCVQNPLNGKYITDSSRIRVRNFTYVKYVQKKKTGLDQNMLFALKILMVKSNGTVDGMPWQSSSGQR